MYPCILYFISPPLGALHSIKNHVKYPLECIDYPPDICEKVIDAKCIEMEIFLISVHRSKQAENRNKELNDDMSQSVYS